MSPDHQLQFEDLSETTSCDTVETTPTSLRVQYCFDIQQLEFNPVWPRIFAPRPQAIRYLHFAPGSVKGTLKRMCALSWTIQDLYYVQSYRNFIAAAQQNQRPVGNSEEFDSHATQYISHYWNLACYRLSELWDYIVPLQRVAPEGSLTRDLVAIFLQFNISIAPDAKLILPPQHEILPLCIAIGERTISWIGNSSHLRTKWVNISHFPASSIVYKIDSQEGNITFPTDFGIFPQVWEDEAFM